jgi:hypothetical protein
LVQSPPLGEGSGNSLPIIAIWLAGAIIRHPGLATIMKIGGSRWSELTCRNAIRIMSPWPV